MDRATSGLEGTDSFGLPTGRLPAGFDPAAPGPLDRSTAIALLAEADDLLAANEPQQALARYYRVFGNADRDVSAAALYGAGNALYRLDRDDEALRVWEQATQLGETPVTYRAWRQVAAARVRAGDLRGALDAYRQCERRAPREDRPEIASRLGWLSKETGNRGAASRYFARSRGDTLAPFLTYLVIAVTAVVSLVADQGSPQGQQLLSYLWLDKHAVANGEYYRLFTVTLVHGGLLHLLFNMYALYLAGVIVEKLYGWGLFAFFYVATAVAASTASFVFGDPRVPSVGASGAIFGLFGILFISMRVHHPMLDRQSRQIGAQIGFLIVMNLALGFMIPNIDMTAHIGGLLAGLWLGYLIPPSQAATLAALWQAPGGRGRDPAWIAARILGVAALAAVVVAGIVVGPTQLF